MTSSKDLHEVFHEMGTQIEEAGDSWKLLSNLGLGEAEMRQTFHCGFESFHDALETHGLLAERLSQLSPRDQLQSLYNYAFTQGVLCGHAWARRKS